EFRQAAMGHLLQSTTAYIVESNGMSQPCCGPSAPPSRPRPSARRSGNNRTPCGFFFKLGSLPPFPAPRTAASRERKVFEPGALVRHPCAESLISVLNSSAANASTSTAATFCPDEPQRFRQVGQADMHNHLRWCSSRSGPSLRTGLFSGHAARGSLLASAATTSTWSRVSELELEEELFAKPGRVPVSLPINSDQVHAGLLSHPEQVLPPEPRRCAARRPLAKLPAAAVADGGRAGSRRRWWRPAAGSRRTRPSKPFEARAVGPATFQQNSKPGDPRIQRQVAAASGRWLGSGGAAADVRLASVMSEQLADHEREQQLLRQDLRLAAKLQALAPVEVQSGNGEESRLAKDEHEVASSSPAGQGGESDSDFVLALMLQQEFDREFDRQVRLSEAKLNGNQKVRVTLSNHLRRDTTGAPASDSEEDPAATAVEPPLLPPGQRAAFNSRGVSGRGADLLTKHDAEICGRRNAERMAGFGTPASAPATPTACSWTTALKVHAAQEERRSAARRQRDSQPAEPAWSSWSSSRRQQQLDERTRRLLQRLVTIRRLRRSARSAESGRPEPADPRPLRLELPLQGRPSDAPDVVVKVFGALQVAALLRGSAQQRRLRSLSWSAVQPARLPPPAACASCARPSPTSPAGVASPAPLCCGATYLLTRARRANAVAAPSHGRLP
uniref:RING-type domain-containing protein n=1 Tax=Macrostomum lignano TaxID=282301 RepID=A0A1I8FCY8_9PLAT